MAVVSKTVLKSYFEDGKEPDENKYIDLIDTMGVGDMLKSVYDTNDDGKVNSAVNADAAPWSGITGKPSTYPATTPVADSSKLGNVAAVEYLKRLSASRPGVDRIYRRDSDSGYNLQTAWDGTYWELKGYNGDTYHAPVQVGDADTVDGYHASNLYRSNANFATSGYLDTSSYVDAAGGFRVNGSAGGIYVPLSTNIEGSSFGGAGYGTQGPTGITISSQWSGVPSTVKGLNLRLIARDSAGHILTGQYASFGPTSINPYQVAVHPIGNDSQAENTGIVSITTSNTIYFRCVASSGGALDIWAAVIGYFL